MYTGCIIFPGWALTAVGYTQARTDPMSAAHPAPPCQRPRFWELTLGAALVLLFCWRLAFTNQILARGDTFLYFYPLWDYRAAALLAVLLPAREAYRQDVHHSLNPRS